MKIQVRYNGRWFRPTQLRRVFIHDVTKQYWAVIGPLGAVQYSELLLPEGFSPIPGPQSFLTESYPNGRMSADLSWHQSSPMHPSQKPLDGCHLLNGPCYIQASVWGARACREILDIRGELALWDWLEQHYREFWLEEREVDDGD